MPAVSPTSLLTSESLGHCKGDITENGSARGNRGRGATLHVALGFLPSSHEPQVKPVAACDLILVAAHGAPRDRLGFCYNWEEMGAGRGAVNLSTVMGSDWNG